MNFKSALIIVDVQNDYFKDGKLQVPDSEEILPVIKNLLEKVKFDLVIFSQNYHFEVKKEEITKEPHFVSKL